MRMIILKRISVGLLTVVQHLSVFPHQLSLQTTLRSKLQIYLFSSVSKAFLGLKTKVLQNNTTSKNIFCSKTE